MTAKELLEKLQALSEEDLNRPILLKDSVCKSFVEVNYFCKFNLEDTEEDLDDDERCIYYRHSRVNKENITEFEPSFVLYGVV